MSKKSTDSNYRETGKNQKIIMLIKAKIRAPAMAVPHPLILKFFIIPAAILKMIALITKVNRPKVRIFTGSVRRIKIGLNIMFRKPTIRLAIMALPKLATSNPLTTLDVRKMPKAERVQPNKRCSMY
jgi:hypothetical protein